MISSVGISLTGLNAASHRLANSAHNVANLASTSRLVDGRAVEGAPDALETVQSSIEPTGGVRAETRSREPGTQKIYAPESVAADENGLVEVPNVSLEEEVVQQEFSTYTYQANLKALKAADNMMQSLLNIKS